MTDLIQIDKSPVKEALRILLQDKTTGQNIIFATDMYSSYGYTELNQMTEVAIRGFDSFDIQPRVLKAQAEQAVRTRKNAEVFTPTWICNLMNNYCDNMWFGTENVFNTIDDKLWHTNAEPVPFENDAAWQKYVDSRRLEITCGEAPYIVSRYDATTGELIAVKDRIGILDRKLRVIGENTDTKDLWTKWVYRAFQSVYGYEFQGDNLLIARINILLTYCDYYFDKWKCQPPKNEILKIANIISWNFWQMDGLTDKIPVGFPSEDCKQLSLFEETLKPVENSPSISCKINNWRFKNSFIFSDIKGGKAHMKFDYVIGNPPYQQDSVGANESDTPLYHFFFESAFNISDKVELITPARFLFNAGYTPKAWNEKMLKDEHFKVLYYEPKSSKVFANTDIKGGVCITFRDLNQSFGAIGVFTAFPELNSINKKVQSFDGKSLSDIISNRGLYRYSDLAYSEQPEEMKKTADPRIAPSCFERMPALFTDDKPNDGHEYIQILGVIKNTRYYKWFRKDYVKEVDNLYKYKVLIPKANGSGTFGEVLSTPVCCAPLCGFTETFISIGITDSKDEAEAILKYIKTKFLRTMLGILKVTQNNARPTWQYVPMQDFTVNSDIDWSKSVAEIDRQLYKKYNLSEEEIEFIESHVKEMT